MDEPVSYTAEEIVPIPAKCVNPRCGYDWVDGVRESSPQLLRLWPHLRGDPPRPNRDAIRAPSLRGCRCFWCGGALIPHPDYPPVIDAETARTTHQRQLPGM